MAETVDRGRRAFLTGGARGLTGGARGHGNAAGPPPTMPPWLEEAALSRCTGCAECASACPTGIIAMEGELPRISFAQGECTFCEACAEVCPQDLFDTSRRPFAHRAEIANDCLIYSGVECRSCGDACPEAAIRFRPRIGGPFLPEIRTNACTGCGACLAPCPVDAVTIVPLSETVDA